MDFLRCQLGNGQTEMFWYDSWTELGPLLNFIGAAGPCQMRVRLSARVVAATLNGSWNLHAASSAQSETLHIALTTIHVPDQSMEDDNYLWIQANRTFGSSFSSKITWECIRVPSPV